MGVPKFFKFLLKKYKKDDFFISRESTYPQMKEKLNNIDYLMLDANGLMHPACFKVIEDNPTIVDQKKLQVLMHTEIINKIKYLIDYVKHKKGVYIGVDGVAPAAKMKQQRYRRFHSVSEKNLFDKLKLKYKKELGSSWNNSVITPGTKFMRVLHERLLTALKELGGLEYIYSSCYTPGEGEHKLIKYMKENPNNSYVIHGLDADLIFLCLSTQMNSIYLLREANEIDNKDKSIDLKFVIMDKLREVIPQSMKAYIKQTNVDSNRLIDDFIFLCYLLGNDFLPHLHSIDINYNSVDLILETYGHLFNNKYILNNSNINQKYILDIFKILAEKEEGILQEHYNNKKNYRIILSDPYEREKSNIENLKFKIDDPIKIGSDDYKLYRERYYKYYWNVSSELETFSKKLVYHYLMGLKWVTQYYFKDCPSWDWYFPFDFPPFINDIYKYMKEINMDDIEFTLGKPVDPIVQLLTVLPPQSSFILPKEFQKLMHDKRSSLIYLYPTDIDHDYIGKTKYYQGLPKLPPMDIDLVKHIYIKYKDELKDTIPSLDIFHFGLRN